MIQVRGYAKVLAHLMFGILVLTVDQLMRLVANLSLELEGRVSLSTKREAEGKVCSQTDKSASRKSILWNIWLILGMRL
jgi:hypothetical protein